MDLFKQTKCELSGSEEDFELEKDTCKGSAIVFSGEFQGDGEGVKSFTYFPRDWNPGTAQLRAQTDKIAYV